MMNDSPIGRKVYPLEDDGKGGLKMNSEFVYEVVKVIPYDKCHDWCNHFIIKSENGKMGEIREYSCVNIPDTTQPLERMIGKFLDDNGVWCDVYTKIKDAVIAVSISWGDWKHSHLWCKNLMGYLGYKQIGEEVTEENGSDCYSAIHYFMKTI